MSTPRRSAVWLRGATARPCGRESILFSGASSTQFCFARSVTAMPRGLHAGLCHAFLVRLFCSVYIQAEV